MHDIGTRGEVQARLRLELAGELGEGEEVSLDKRKCELPYLTACFYETLRTTCSAIVPHMANRDTSIAGTITVIVSLYDMKWLKYISIFRKVKISLIVFP